MNLATWEDDGLRRFGEHVALVTRDRSWTNRDLHDASCRFASALVALGVAPGDRVLTLLPNSAELMIASSAIWRCGAVLVLGFADAAPPEVRRIADHAGAVVAIGTATAMARSATVLASVGRRIVVTPTADVESHVFGRLVVDHAPLPSPVPRTAEDPAQITYTSGTTGEPKGVVYTHGATDAVLRWRAEYDHQSHSSIELVVLPPTAFSARVLRTRFAARHALVVHDSFDAHEAVAAIEKHRVTRVALVPSMCEAILAIPDLGVHDFTSVREVMVAGASVTRSLAERIERVFGVAPAIHYGMAEIGGPLTWPTSEPKPGSVGRAAVGAEIEIIDASGRSLPSGDVGSIRARAPWMSVGYYRRPDLTAEAFVDGWLRTGDLGYLDEEGDLFLAGRSRDVIIQGGVNVYPQEVVEVIELLPGVRECAVFGVPGDLLGEEVVACIVRSDPGLDVAAVRAHCFAQMDRRKAPVHVRFAEELPKNATGKVVLDLLRQELLAEKPDATETTLVAMLRARDATDVREEHVLDHLRATIARVLHVPAAAVAPDATFLSVGIDSLSSLSLANTIERELGIRLASAVLSGNNPIRSAVPLVLDGLLSSRPPVTASAVPTHSGPVPLVASLAEFMATPWAFNQRSADRFTVGAAVPLEEATPWEHVRSALQHLRDSHDALRSQFVQSPDGRWMQHFEAAGAPVAFTCESHLAEKSVNDIASDVARRVEGELDIRHGPVFRVVGVDRGSGRPGLVVIVTHHLVTDLYSLGLLAEELLDAIRRIRSGRALAPPTIASFAAWASEVDRQGRSEEFAAELSFWKNVPFVRVHEKQLRQRRPGVPPKRAHKESLWSHEETEAVSRLGRECIEEILLAAFCVAVRARTGDDELLVRCVRHLRDLVPSLDTSRTIGWLVTHVPVHVDLREGASPSEALRAVRTAWAAIPNGGKRYLALKHASGDPDLAAQHAPDLQFAFEGAAPAAEAPRWSPLLLEEPDPARPGFDLHCVTMLVMGRIFVAVGYDGARHEAAAIEHMLETLRQAALEIAKAPSDR